MHPEKSNLLQKHLKLYIEKYGKLSLKKKIPKSHFLPSLTVVMTDLGFIPSSLNVTKFIEKEHNTSLDLSVTSRRNIDHGGISLRSINKIISWIRNINPALLKEMSTSLSLLRIQMTGSTASEWMPTLIGARWALAKQNIEHDFPLLENYIVDRCRIQDQFIRNARRSIKNKSFNIDNKKEIWANFRTLWDQNTRVPKTQLDIVSRILSLHDPKSDNSSFNTPEIELPVLYLEYDFYLEAIPLFEIELLTLLSKKIELLPATPWVSRISQAIAAYSLNEESENTKSIDCCFGGLLHILKTNIPIQSEGYVKIENIGWRKLSSFIDINEQGSSEDLTDRQYNIIKDWRKGRVRPSNIAFKKFMSNYLNEFNHSENGIFELYFPIFIMLDKISERSLEEFKNGEHHQAAKEKIKEILNQYPVYYQECLNRVKKKAKPQ
ncbi:MAG: hypothetical protein ACI9DG_001681 [Oleispira sp.]|jgi:hypothetical protein